jgi:hypothetical protein
VPTQSRRASIRAGRGAAVLLLLVPREDYGAAVEKRMSALQPMEGFVRESNTGSAWPVPEYQLEGRIVCVGIATVHLPRDGRPPKTQCDTTGGNETDPATVEYAPSPVPGLDLALMYKSGTADRPHASRAAPSHPHAEFPCDGVEFLLGDQLWIQNPLATSQIEECRPRAKGVVRRSRPGRAVTSSSAPPAGSALTTVRLLRTDLSARASE